jgi:hypothetical protein
MNKTMTISAGAALSALLALTSIVPAQAQSGTFGYGQRDRVIRTYCDRHPRDSDCRRYNSGGWHNGDYDDFYGRNRTDLDSIASGFFGFTFGAILGSALANSGDHGDRVVVRSGSDHVQACYAHFRSYDERSDSYLGYDGDRHRCML